LAAPAAGLSTLFSPAASTPNGQHLTHTRFSSSSLLSLLLLTFLLSISSDDEKNYFAELMLCVHE